MGLARKPATIIAGVVLFFSLGAASDAAAKTRSLFSHTAIRSLGPTPRQVAADLRVAARYWHTVPRCGWPTVTYGTVAGRAQDGSRGAADADSSSCAITYSAAAFDWVDFPSTTCQTMVHEYGHLVLGPLFFRASNPTNPAHSPDPASIMYWNPRIGAATARRVGCPVGEFR